VKQFQSRIALAVLITPILAATLGPASAEECFGGGVPRLNNVAQRLHVRPSGSSRSALNACDGRAYEIGSLLDAALSRIEKLEAAQRKETKK
jgi:hypothetical protein